MRSRTLALRVAGTIFGIVAVAHLFRVVMQVDLMAGGYRLPIWLSVPGCIGAGALSAWLWWLASADGK